MDRVRAVCVALLPLLAAAALARAGEEIALFNGKDLEGWTFRGRTPEDENPFYVEKGILCCRGRPVGYLRTNRKYRDFVLKLEWRWPEGSKPGNNGVLLSIQDGKHFYDNTWPKSIELQLFHQHAGDILTIGGFPLQTGRNRGRYTPRMKDSNEKPPGEWNEYEMSLRKGRLRVLVNGQLQNEATEVARLPGYIGLQSEGAPIQFRNIRLVPFD